MAQEATNYKLLALILIGTLLALAFIYVSSRHDGTTIRHHFPYELSDSLQTNDIRVAGLVVGNSIVRNADGNVQRFVITDEITTVTVDSSNITYPIEGGVGIIATGSLESGLLQASSITELPNLADNLPDPENLPRF